MKVRGFNNNVSAYLADCIRRDRERTLELTRLESDFIEFMKSRGRSV
jgi:hypothetical protein